MRPALAALAAVTVVHLASQLVEPEALWADATQVLLMPLLALVLLTGTTSPRSRLVRLVLVALVFSWLGDTVPRFLDGDAGFLAMVGCFLLAQLAYVVAFWPWRHRSVAARWPLLAPYVLALLVLLVLVGREAGALLAPVVVYGTALTAMAVLATGLGRVAGVGGAIFMVSDSLIALEAFADLELPAHGFWVMLTYVLGQALLVKGVLDVAGSEGRASAPAVA